MTEAVAQQLALFPETLSALPETMLDDGCAEDEQIPSDEPLFVDAALAELDKVCSDIRDTIAAAPEVLLAQSLLLTEAILTARAAEAGEVEIARRLTGLFDRKPNELASHPPKLPRRHIPTYMSNLYPMATPKKQPKTKTYLRRYKVY